MSPDGVWMIGIGRGGVDGVVTGGSLTVGTLTVGTGTAGTDIVGTDTAGTDTLGTVTLGTGIGPDAIEVAAATSSPAQATSTTSSDRRRRSGTGQRSPPQRWAKEPLNLAYRLSIGPLDPARGPDCEVTTDSATFRRYLRIGALERTAHAARSTPGGRDRQHVVALVPLLALSKVSDRHRHARVFRSVSPLLDLYEEHRDELETPNQYRPGWDLIAAAALVARAPDAPLPDAR